MSSEAHSTFPTGWGNMTVTRILLLLLLLSVVARAAEPQGPVPPRAASATLSADLTSQAPAARRDAAPDVPRAIRRVGGKAWTVLFSDDFESTFPGSDWTIFAEAGEPYWGVWTCWSGDTPTHSVGCVAAGPGAIPCGGMYPAYLENWLVHGPFSLAGAGMTAANLEFNLKLAAETNNDYLGVFASVNGSQFYGVQYTYLLEDKITFDLANVPTLGDLIGENEVWIAFLFVSDWSISFGEGAQIDDVVIQADLPVANQAPIVTLTAPDGGESWLAQTDQTITYTASDPDGGPSPLTIALDYSTNGGGAWTEIASGQTNTGSYVWTLPDVETTAARVRVRAFDGADETGDSSDANFTISVSGQNTIALGTGSGPSGTEVTISLSLTNEDPVKGLQTDIVFTAGTAAFSHVTAIGRGVGMTAEGETIATGRARLLLFFDDSTTLAAGDGDVASVTFTLQGAGGGQTAVTPEGAILAGPDAQSWLVDVQAGSLDVEAPTEAPLLQIAALKNPGRTRSVQIVVSVSNGSGAVPTVTAGGVAVTMVALGGAIYQGQYHTSGDVTSLTINASDTNAHGTGTDEVTVTFP